MTIISSSRPPGITCTDWIPATPGSPMCHEYGGQGACNLPTRAWCEEWLKKNPQVALPAAHKRHLHVVPSPPAPPAPPPPPADPHNPPPLALAPSEPKRLSTAAQRAREALAAAQTGSALAAPLPPSLPVGAIAVDPLGELLDKRVRELEGLAEEITLTTDYGIFFIVRTRGENKNNEAPVRREITFHEMALLATVCAVFPGARIVQFQDGSLGGEVPEPTPTTPPIGDRDHKPANVVLTSPLPEDWDT